MDNPLPLSMRVRQAAWFILLLPFLLLFRVLGSVGHMARSGFSDRDKRRD